MHSNKDLVQREKKKKKKCVTVALSLCSFFLRFLCLAVRIQPNNWQWWWTKSSSSGYSYHHTSQIGNCKPWHSYYCSSRLETIIHRCSWDNFNEGIEGLCVHFLKCCVSCSSVHGILQARMLEWVAIPFSNSFPRAAVIDFTNCVAWNSRNLFSPNFEC